MPFHITDTPSNSVPSVYHGGRGGAGNYRKLSKAETLAREVTLTQPLPPTTANKLFFGGRGGAGNAHPSSERAMFSFDEELERDRLISEHQAPVYSIGRGGKGNYVASSVAGTEAASPRSSTSSETSGLGLTQTFSRHSIRNGADRIWEKVRRSS